MAARLSVDDKLAALRRIRGEPPCPEHVAELSRYLGDRSNLVVATSAAIAAERSLVELTHRLEAAYPQFLVDPLKNDKLCRAKIALIQALDKFEHPTPEIFVRAARHVQHEPIWGGSEDTAGPLRAAAIFALARIGDPAYLPLIVDSMVDPLKDVRMAAAQALVTFEHEGGALLLRLKAMIGDAEPEVLTECFAALLTIDFVAHRDLVAGFLNSPSDPRAEAAAIALGRSRSAEVLDILLNAWHQTIDTPLKEQILLAIATLRHPAAIDKLIEIVASSAEKDALAALFALKIHNYDSKLRERLSAVVDQSRSASLQARFRRDFPEAAADGR
jgi:HEAT repeat protein